MTRTKRSISELSGIFARPGQKPATIEELNDGIAEGAIASALGEKAAAAFRRNKRPMITGTMTSKGQTTIPKEIREYLRLKPGDKIVWDVVGRHAVVRARNRSIKELKGMLGKPPRTATLEEIEEVIAKGWSGQWSD